LAISSSCSNEINSFIDSTNSSSSYGHKVCLKGLDSCFISSVRLTGEEAVQIGEVFFAFAVQTGLFCLRGEDLSTVLLGETNVSVCLLLYGDIVYLKGEDSHIDLIGEYVHLTGEYLNDADVLTGELIKVSL